MYNKHVNAPAFFISRLNIPILFYARYETKEKNYYV